MLGGFVTSSKMFIGKNNIIDENGLFSQKIFGPINNYRCACGKLSYIIDKNQICEKCGVICGSNELRVKTFGKIELVFPVIKPTKITKILKIIGSKNKHLLNPILSDSNVSQKKYLGISPNGEKIFLTDVLDDNKNYILPLRITGIYSLILIFKYLINNFDGQIPVIDEIKTFFENNFIIKIIKVLPPEIRPVIVDPNKKNTLRVSEINKHYTSLLQLNKSNLIYKNNIPIDEDNWFKLIDVNFRNQIHEEIIEYSIIEFDKITARYQYYTNLIYENMFESISKKKGFIRSSILSKTIEFSARTVIVVDPSIKPYQVRVSRKILFKLWKLHFIYYLTKYKNFEYDYCFENILTKEYEEVKELFNEFLIWFCGEQSNE